MKEDKSEVIATSNDLCNPNQTILIVGEDDHVLIHSEKKVNQGFFRPKSSIFQQVFNPFRFRCIPFLQQNTSKIYWKQK